jgi:Carboxypeptidase regulatory-like domain
MSAAAYLTLFGSLAFGQGGTASITGTVTDPSGSVVSGAAVEATNAQTGVIYSAASTTAGNYTVPNLPVGTYTLSVKVAGFKTYTHPNLALDATQVLREDVSLQVGAATESVTVQAEASLLKTESGEQAHNITLEQLDDAPILGIGAVNSGPNGYRNPYNSLAILPGVTNYSVTAESMTVNGLSSANNSLVETMRIDGLDATNRILGSTIDYPQMTQPNTDSIQEIAYQTSNYAAEFGQAGSVVINMTMKSGTNQYHGTAFDYFVNEDLNSGQPFTSNGNGGKFRPVNRRNDFGGTLGGPITIPKLYNGKDRTFFFWSYEEFLESDLYGFADTVPTAAYRNGDFSAISPNGTCSLCAAQGIPQGPLGGANYTDALGRPMFANEIYDPLSRGFTASGLGFANPFPNNMIPVSRFNTTSLAFAALFPQPTNSNLVGNYATSVHAGHYSALPSLKADQTFTPKDKVSFYWAYNNNQQQIAYPLGNADGLPLEIGGYRGTFIPTTTYRLNYDRTIKPTLLLHLGAGYMFTSFNSFPPFRTFNPSQFGLSGFVLNFEFPYVYGMCTNAGGVVTTAAPVCAGGYGGMQAIGTASQAISQNYEYKPTFNANTTWVKGNHTYKAGAELLLEGFTAGSYPGVLLQAGIPATSQPFTPTASFNGFNTGFGYASFLLGDYTSSTQNANELFRRNGYQQWAIFIQDSWKVTRKLTVDYGLRWDYATPEKEEHGRLGQLDASLANASAGGRLGAIEYASTCNCSFYKGTYPFALGPRLGVAYRLDPKTVIRGGWGFNYQFIANAAGGVFATNGVYPLAGINPYVNISTPGSIVTPTWPVTNPFAYPVAGTVGGLPAGIAPDQNENRPPRINQFSIGFQREITPNFIMEASYVANRAAWTSGPLGELSQISPQLYAAYGLYPYPGTGPCSSGGSVCASSTYNNLSDYLLTTQALSSSTVKTAMAARGFPNFLPYAGFPTGDSLGQALYPYPQFGNIAITGSPTGDSKYDSLQVKATKRFSHGLQANGSFTWGQGFYRPTRQDFFNPASAVWALQQIPPRDLNFNAIYTVPKAAFLPKYVNVLSKDWQIGWYSNYQSGAFLTPPSSPTLNFLASEDIRVPGQPLYTPGVNINDLSTYNPYYTQVLNPNAWAPCPSNSTCAATAVLYKDFRAPRTPSENASIGRHFRVGKEGKYDFFVRAEFVNIFNRTLMPAPTTTNPQNAPIKGAGNGTIYTSGFGIVSAYYPPNTAIGANTVLGLGVTALQGRTGTLIGRFQF